MTTLVLEHDPIAERVEFDGERLVVHLADGRAVSVPLEWFPRLLHATPTERGNWQLLGDGYAVEWPDLDEHIGIAGILAGRRSGESERSFQRWLDTRVLARPQESLVVNFPKYRKRQGASTWHFCANCSSFPRSDFEVETSPGAGEICSECLSRFSTGTCR